MSAQRQLRALLAGAALCVAVGTGVSFWTFGQIEQAAAFAWHVYQQMVEGSGAVGLACALLNQAAGLQRPLIVISGGNIQPETHADLCRRWPVDYFNGVGL